MSCTPPTMRFCGRGCWGRQRRQVWPSVSSSKRSAGRVTLLSGWWNFVSMARSSSRRGSVVGRCASAASSTGSTYSRTGRFVWSTIKRTRRRNEVWLYSFPPTRAARNSSSTDIGEGPWQVDDAAYVAFGDARLRVPLASRNLRRELAKGDARVVEVLDAIDSGTYSPRPAELRRCCVCPYPTVCRKDYVGEG